MEVEPAAVGAALLVDHVDARAAIRLTILLPQFVRARAGRREVLVIMVFRLGVRVNLKQERGGREGGRCEGAEGEGQRRGASMEPATTRISFSSYGTLKKPSHCCGK